MLRMDLQLFGGRGSSSGGGGGGGGAKNYEMTPENSQYAIYDDAYEADAALTDGVWEGNLSSDEVDAIKSYTDNGYGRMNKELRGQDPFYYDEDQRAETLNKIYTMESAIDQYELTRDTVFHRGASSRLLGGAESVEQIQSMVGSVVVDKGFTSTGITVGESFSHTLKFHIATGKGKGIGAYVGNLNVYGEREFVFNYGSAFRITGAYEGAGGKVHVNLEYVGRTK